jgi:hypothetical protein
VVSIFATGAGPMDPPVQMDTGGFIGSGETDLAGFNFRLAALPSTLVCWRRARDCNRIIQATFRIPEGVAPGIGLW